MSNKETKVMRKTFSEMLDESEELEAIAKTIQVGEDVGLSAEGINGLASKYQSWFAECLVILPDDLRDKFRAEYEGTWISFKIKKFLEAPTQPNTLRLSVRDERTATQIPYWLYSYERAFHSPLLAQRQILLEASKRPIISFIPTQTVEIVELLSRRFHLLSQQLMQRHNKRRTLKINDEYDVQDLFHTLLRLFFDDIRGEEFTPSYAGGSSRMDFVLKAEQTVIELKMTRDGLNDKELGRQLKLDIADYHSHADCKSLVIFVYDPKGYIRNPRGIENDLNRIIDGMPVKVIIAQG